MTMVITINQQPQQVAQGRTLQQIQQELQLPTLGCVFAINDNIISKGLWAKTYLNDGDQISLFQAIAGG
ncbi:sulfur carrier protein ThiS [Vibrio sp. V27_P1S3P104]|nr:MULTISPECIES: sulfur carrier protein ThiS [unclassified Vibrio]NAW69134.1 sulfur carrier protein ThiS [Vibrio sp. V28_P6S34P95]NAX03899.1 sulfur carrier protein ThiS [Vibrio sp. V30_P3S12P165]NAX33559.1 sulfur carrier protein ThiS [Vibrio sp. V29_P1S30P107]NAX37488.1 sulfur carrier protein ThiS [Vibrio sp. V27_P1S3P104]NAX39422.1 sulfur carrier protein ThiS [Vibrio sp. V26_P1S5P106]